MFKTRGILKNEETKTPLLLKFCSKFFQVHLCSFNIFLSHAQLVSKRTLCSWPYDKILAEFRRGRLKIVHRVLLIFDENNMFREYRPQPRNNRLQSSQYSNSVFLAHSADWSDATRYVTKQRPAESERDFRCEQRCGGIHLIRTEKTKLDFCYVVCTIYSVSSILQCSN